MQDTPICVDASIVIPLITHSAEGSPVLAYWRAWDASGRRIVAPTLIYYEICNALHRYAVHGELQPDEAEAALNTTLELDIELHGDQEMHRRALMLARKYGLSATYDAHYLALAERLRAEFWTADRRLHAATHVHLSWMNLLEL